MSVCSQSYQNEEQKFAEGICLNSDRAVSENNMRKIGSGDFKKQFLIKNQDSARGRENGGDRSISLNRERKQSKRSLSFFG